MTKQTTSSTSPTPEQKRNLKPVLTAVERKRSLGERLKAVILSNDGSDIRSKIKKDAETTTKNLIFDSFRTIGEGLKDAVGTAIFGEDYAAKKRRAINQQSGFINYGGFYYPSITSSSYTSPVTATGATQGGVNKPSVTNPRWQFDGYALTAETEVLAKELNLLYDPSGVIAQRVPDGLMECIASKNVALVSDFFDLVNKSWDYTAQSWGWNNLNPDTCRVTREHGVWVLNIPDPVPVRR